MAENFSTGTNELVDKLAGRVALLNAENERLKKIITRYEKKIASDYNNSTEGSLTNSSQVLAEKQREVDRLREIGHERLAEVEHWKKECAELAQRLQAGVDPMLLADTVRQEVQASIQGFREEVSKLQAEKNRLAAENERLRKSTVQGSPDYNRLIKKLKIEVEELRERVEVMKVEKAGMVTREYHFEKLKELEVNLITSWSKAQGPLHLSNKSGRSRDMLDSQHGETIHKLQQDLLEITHENEKLVNVIRNFQDKQSGESRRTEQEARRRMEGLEQKINALIEENENILRENQHLKQMTQSKIGSSGHNKPGRRPSGNLSSADGTAGDVGHQLKELETRLECKDAEISNQRHLMEKRIKTLEKELQEARARETTTHKTSSENISHTSHTASANGPSMDYMKQSLEEAYGLIMKLEKENNLLLSRIDHLETDNQVRVQDNQKLYAVIESKNRVQETLLRERQESERAFGVNGDQTPGFGALLMSNHHKLVGSKNDGHGQEKEIDFTASKDNQDLDGH